MGICKKCGKRMFFSDGVYCGQCYENMISEERRKYEKLKHEYNMLVNQAQEDKKTIKKLTETIRVSSSIQASNKESALDHSVSNPNSVQKTHINLSKESLWEYDLDTVKKEYNHWTFTLYKRLIISDFKDGIKHADSLEADAYRKEIAILDSCMDVAEINTRIKQIPHYENIKKLINDCSFCAELKIPADIWGQHIGGSIEIGIIENSAFIPLVRGKSKNYWDGDYYYIYLHSAIGTRMKEELIEYNLLLTEEEINYYELFGNILSYGKIPSEIAFDNGWVSSGITYEYLMTQIDKSNQMDSIYTDELYTNSTKEQIEKAFVTIDAKDRYVGDSRCVDATFMPIEWNEYCDISFENYRRTKIEKINEKNRKERSFADFLSN